MLGMHLSKMPKKIELDTISDRFPKQARVFLLLAYSVRFHASAQWEARSGSDFSGHNEIRGDHRTKGNLSPFSSCAFVRPEGS